MATAPKVAPRRVLALLGSVRVLSVSYANGKARAVIALPGGGCVDTARHGSALSRRLAAFGVPPVNEMTPAARSRLAAINAEIDARLEEIPEWRAARERAQTDASSRAIARVLQAVDDHLEAIRTRSEPMARKVAAATLAGALSLAVSVAIRAGAKPDAAAKVFRSMMRSAIVRDVLES